MTSFALKTIALAAMLVDHMGAILFPQYSVMRIIGRLTMPIMCFCIGEGYRHTSNVNRYIGRLFIFALISEIPFDFAVNWEILEFYHQNVFFSLALGLLAIYAYDKLKGFAGIAAVLGIAFLSDVIRCDYGSYAVILVLFLYIAMDSKKYKNIWIAVTLVFANYFFYGTGIQSYSNFALIPIMLYNGERGTKTGLWFYAFYPLHLIAIGIAARIMFAV